MFVFSLRLRSFHKLKQLVQLTVLICIGLLPSPVQAQRQLIQFKLLKNVTLQRIGRLILLPLLMAVMASLFGFFVTAIVGYEKPGTMVSLISATAVGVLVLTGFLCARLAQNRPLSFGASLVFEQTYEAIDGDSASLAEV